MHLIQLVIIVKIATFFDTRVPFSGSFRINNCNYIKLNMYSVWHNYMFIIIIIIIIIIARFSVWVWNLVADIEGGT